MESVEEAWMKFRLLSLNCTDILMKNIYIQKEKKLEHIPETEGTIYDTWSSLILDVEERERDRERLGFSLGQNCLHVFV